MSMNFGKCLMEISLSHWWRLVSCEQIIVFICLLNKSGDILFVSGPGRRRIWIFEIEIAKTER